MIPEAAKMNANLIDPMIPIPVRIQKLVWETDNVYTLYLKPNSELNPVSNSHQVNLTCCMLSEKANQLSP